MPLKNSRRFFETAAAECGRLGTIGKVNDIIDVIAVRAEESLAQQGVN